MPLPMERWPGSLGVSDRVLIVRLGAVGDVLRVLPAARRLRAALPGLRLDWIVEPLSAPLLEGHPDLDDVILFRRRDLRPDPARPAGFRRAWRELSARLRSAAYSVAIDFQGSFKSGLVTRVSGAPRRVGFRPGETRELSFLFTNEWVTLSAPRLNRVDRNLELCAALGVCGGPEEARLPEHPEEAADAARILASLAPTGARLIVSPGTSRRQAYKAWPAKHYAAMARQLAPAGVRPIIVWGPGEEPLARAVVEASAGAAILAPPTRLRGLAAILRRSDLFVGADTGPMHLAWVAGCRVVALFGPTDARLNAPRGDGHVVLCAPGGNMAELEARTVAAAVLAALAASRTTGHARRLPDVAPASGAGAS